MTTPPVTFDGPTFTGMFPEFSPLPPATLTGYFMRATGSIVANSTTNPAFPDGNLAYLCYLATAHVAWLNCPKDANGNPTSASGAEPASPLVGRISSATQGSVTVQTELPVDASASAMEKYLSQTRYGLELWLALDPYRRARYLARPTRIAGTSWRFGLQNPLGWR